MGSTTSAQVWAEVSPIPLPIPSEGLVKVIAAPWGDNYYFLDELSMEVLATNYRGGLEYRYGGWGTGSMSLDLPRELAVAENSVFVLDQGGPRILRLDTRLNPVAVTPLPEDRVPLTFIRDTRQRFWVAFEHYPGLQLFNDEGNLVDELADESSGSAAILHPVLMAASHLEVAVWDPIDRLICLFYHSGQLRHRFPLPGLHSVLAMTWAGPILLVATEEEVFEIDPTHGEVKPLPPTKGIIALTYRAPNVYGLDRSGILRVLLPVP
jgi:hypothetical protein